MRDETKAAVICSVVLSVLILVLFLSHPVDWNWRDLTLPPPPRQIEQLLPPAQFDEFLAAYGPPTSEEQSPGGILIPPLFTKWLDYEPEHLRVAFVAAESAGDPSDRSWILISFVDARKTIPISAEEAARRLKSRRK
jgi:hypothetical protein